MKNNSGEEHKSKIDVQWYTPFPSFYLSVTQGFPEVKAFVFNGPDGVFPHGFVQTLLKSL